MDLIDRTNLPRTVTHFAETEYEAGFEEGQQSIIEAINDAPTVDAEPVVRCRDCKWWNGKRCYVMCVGAQVNSYDENFFCKIGEQKDGEQK